MIFATMRDAFAQIGACFSFAPFSSVLQPLIDETLIDRSSGAECFITPPGAFLMRFVAPKASVQKPQSPTRDVLAVHLSGHLQEKRPRRPSWKRFLKLFGTLRDGLTVHLEPKRLQIGASIRQLWTYETLCIL